MRALGTREDPISQETAVIVEHDVSSLLGRVRETIRTAGTASPAERPCVTLAFAQSLDGCIAAHAGTRTQIGCPEAQRFAHALRALHDGILVGVDTVLVDDPQLTVRHAPGQDPRPIVIDSRLRTPVTARLLQRADNLPIIATTHAACEARAAELAAAGAEVLRLSPNDRGQIDLPDLFATLGRRGFGSVMVEGGARIITSVLTRRLAHQVAVTVSLDLLGGVRAVEPLGHIPAPLRPRLENVRCVALATGLIIHGQLDGASWHLAPGGGRRTSRTCPSEVP